MPTAIVYTLRPRRQARVEASMGRAAHAAVLERIARANQALASELHNEARVKPLTVAAFLGADTNGTTVAVHPNTTMLLRVTLLAEAVERALPHALFAQGEELTLGGATWQVKRVARQQHEHCLAGSASYESLLAEVLRKGGNADMRWSFTFASPLMFRQGNQCQPLPMPGAVFGSLLDRWNALATVPLAEEIRQFASESLVVNSFDLRSVAVAGKGGVPQIGAVGTCSYTATRRDPYISACLTLLGRFAFYSGVGAGTTRGFGQTHLNAPRRAVASNQEQGYARAD